MPVTIQETIRQKIVDAIVAKLADIRVKNGYTRDVGPKRVYSASKLPSQIPTPAIVLHQGNEMVATTNIDKYEVDLPIHIGFVDSYSGKEPDEEANIFLGEIQLALTGYEITVQANDYRSGSSYDVVARILETANGINNSDAIRGKCFGEISLIVKYSRSIYDPSKA